MPQLVVPALIPVLGPIAANVVAYVGFTALSYAANKLLAPSLSGQNQGITTNIREPAAPQEIVYGQVRKGGVVTYLETTGNKNKYLHLIIALAGHECEELGDIYINDEIVTINSSGQVTTDRWGDKIYIYKHRGAQTAVTDAFDNVSGASLSSTLLAETNNDIGDDFVGAGIAYLYVRLEYSSKRFGGGIPTFTCVVKGKQVLDMSDAATTYPQSANAALVIRDHIRSGYGLNDDSINTTAFAAAVSTSDENVPVSAGGTQKRYTIDGIVNTSSTSETTLSDMIRACGGVLYWAGGQWKLKVGEFTASEMSLTLDDFRSGITLPTRKSRRDNYNRVIGKFIHAEADHIEADFPAVTSAAFLSEDAEIENTLDLNLNLITDPTRAQRVAKMTLFRQREQMTLSADFGIRALDLTVGDTVDLTIEDYGFEAKPFEVAEWRLTEAVSEDGVKVRMTLQEASSEAYDWDAEEQDIIANNTTLPSYWEGIDVGVSLSAVKRVQGEKLFNTLLISVTTDAPEQVDFVEVEYKKSSDIEYEVVGTGEVDETTGEAIFEVLDVERTTFDVRARTTSALGIKGDYAEASLLADAVGDAPADVSGLDIEAAGNALILNWEPVPDLDLSYYEIRHSIQESGAGWGSSLGSVKKVARPGVSATVPLRSGTYHIRAYDKGGVQSSAASSVVVPSSYLPTYGNTLTQSEDPSFGGTKTGLSVVSSQLRLTSPVSAGDTGTYDFSNYIDTSSVRRVWARIEAAALRLDDSAGLWDDLSGNIDSLPGLWDDLTQVQLADHNVEFYISTTDDNPASSPTWTSYRKFRAGFFSGRAFRFRLVFSTEADNITTGVTSLDAIVEY